MSLTRFLKGFLIILIGVILLLNNLNILEWTVWPNILKLWPLLLISLGISLIFRKRLSWLAPLVILLGIIYGISASYTDLNLQLEGKIPIEVETIQREVEMVPAAIPKIEEEVISETIPEEEVPEKTIEAEDIEDEKLLVSDTLGDKETTKEFEMVPLVQKANLHLNYTVGSFVLRFPTPLVYQCQVSYRYPGFKPLEDFSVQDHEAKILITHQSVTDQMVRNSQNHIDLQLNTGIVYDIFLETGATSIDYDLSKFKIENFSIKSGASKIDIIAPQYNGKININSGVSKIDIAIPDNVGAKVILDTGISKKDFDEHFSKQDGNVYFSENYNNAEYRVDIKIDSGISKIHIYYL
ncbi:MAG TPA: DUF5668 domain-containing protein [Atribacterota bacterium]|nr:DUF5668 domain-containing protein [Atribacterota bacterium]